MDLNWICGVMQGCSNSVIGVIVLNELVGVELACSFNAGNCGERGRALSSIHEKDRSSIE